MPTPFSLLWRNLAPILVAGDEPPIVAITSTAAGTETRTTSGVSSAGIGLRFLGGRAVSTGAADEQLTGSGLQGAAGRLVLGVIPPRVVVEELVAVGGFGTVVAEVASFETSPGAKGTRVLFVGDGGDEKKLRMSAEGHRKDGRWGVQRVDRWIMI